MRLKIGDKVAVVNPKKTLPKHLHKYIGKLSEVEHINGSAYILTLNKSVYFLNMELIKITDSRDAELLKILYEK